MSLPYSGFSPYNPVDTVDETADYSDMQGPSSTANQMAGVQTWTQSPTKMLVVTWFVALALYWLVGVFFRGQRK